MTEQPAVDLPPLDLGNPFLEALAAAATDQITILDAITDNAVLTTARLDTPAGPRLVVTLRGAGATITVLLSQSSIARAWGEHLIAQGTLHLGGLHLPGQSPVNGHQPPGAR